MRDPQLSATHGLSTIGEEIKVDFGVNLLRSPKSLESYLLSLFSLRY